jgi:hypothetical protein
MAMIHSTVFCGCIAMPQLPFWAQREHQKASKHSDTSQHSFLPHHAQRPVSGTICRVNTASCRAGVTQRTVIIATPNAAFLAPFAMLTQQAELLA